MKRYGITKQETKDGVMYRIRTLAEINRHKMNNTERITRWFDSSFSKEIVTKMLKEMLENTVQRLREFS